MAGLVRYGSCQRFLHEPTCGSDPQVLNAPKGIMVVRPVKGHAPWLNCCAVLAGPAGLLRLWSGQVQMRPTQFVAAAAQLRPPSCAGGRGRIRT